MNFIKLCVIALIAGTIEQFTLSSQINTKSYKITSHQQCKLNRDIYDKFAQFLCTQFSDETVYQYMIDAQAVSFQHSKTKELALNIAAIQFNRLSKLEQQNLLADSIDKLLCKMSTSYHFKKKL